ncbi:polysaccharide export outer membrane protein [Roseinatronobacter thiooxidans]|uniref:Polysaccharide export outer membrane protein n=2 Tax=Roseinatronobacter thiooxidans TaxID=121821 RepID=A0A2W7QC02_9RHOB|nr:polysaccharide export outer membrane protein [Roseinatronobacter thiooxidans]
MAAAVSRRNFILGCTAFSISGCAVPRGAPSKREMVAGADATDADFALEIVSRDRLPLYANWGHSRPSRPTSWPASAAVPQDQRLAPGDILALRIWDAEESSLITPADERFSDIANLTVDSSGHVSLPFVGEVHVGGLTVNSARQRLQSELVSIIPSAQVQVEVRQGRRNSVDILGGVANPGTYPLSERNLPISSLISTAGGVDSALNNAQVQITRASNVYRRPLADVLTIPAADVPLQGGDRVLIEADPRSFTVVGAAGREDVIGFDAETVSALRAVSRMGGMADTRADPRGILVLRRYPDAIVSQPNGPPHPRVVFSFDLTAASGMFSADDFELQDRDILVATQAPALTTQRVLALFGSLLSFGRAAGSF